MQYSIKSHPKLVVYQVEVDTDRPDIKRLPILNSEHMQMPKCKITTENVMAKYLFLKCQREQ